MATYLRVDGGADFERAVEPHRSISRADRAVRQMWDITNPRAPVFVTYANNCDFTVAT